MNDATTAVSADSPAGVIHRSSPTTLHFRKRADHGDASSNSSRASAIETSSTLTLSPPSDSAYSSPSLHHQAPTNAKHRSSPTNASSCAPRHDGPRSESRSAAARAAELRKERRPDPMLAFLKQQAPVGPPQPDADTWQQPGLSAAEAVLLCAASTLSPPSDSECNIPSNLPSNISSNIPSNTPSSFPSDGAGDIQATQEAAAAVKSLLVSMQCFIYFI